MYGDEFYTSLAWSFPPLQAIHDPGRITPPSLNEYKGDEGCDSRHLHATLYSTCIRMLMLATFARSASTTPTLFKIRPQANEERKQEPFGSGLKTIWGVIRAKRNFPRTRIELVTFRLQLPLQPNAMNQLDHRGFVDLAAESNESLPMHVLPAYKRSPEPESNW
ncbi:hypothetical protein BO86DRAFT_379093 [Aspergillus japonicus CBS 114.51]|uniref:Uncharacterized protein n=1 Tax=Aspergillus japonicus CBS 114.51 TaxID=1448312 RepID=A0A8T8X2H3_ASPJA|nr:hypothetical protein BO86DRAFT_379093 [Aspergillus japonicus CBS 114.51]RAH82120.1 hypothetical protein BO86DRAFT_379093 [Aspergillus japonicus CBS 114.51]